MDNALVLQVEGLGFDTARERVFSFFRSRLFCFVRFLKKKHIGRILQHQCIKK